MFYSVLLNIQKHFVYQGRHIYCVDGYDEAQNCPGLNYLVSHIYVRVLNSLLCNIGDLARTSKNKTHV